MPDAEIIPFQPRRPGRRPGHGRTRATRDTPPGLSFTQAVESWELALNSRGRSADTIRSYRDTIAIFAGWLSRAGRCICAHEAPVEPCPVRPESRAQLEHVPTVEQVTREMVRQFLVHERRRTSEGNAHKQFRNLRAFYRWLDKQGHLEKMPVDNDDAPNVPEKEFPPFTEDEIRKLLATCRRGTRFEDRRDYAIMRILIDIGPRVGGLANLRYTPDEPRSNDVQLAKYRLHVRLKGGDEYDAPIGKKTAEAIDRYIRLARSHHPDADEPWLWLGRWGRLQKSGIQQMIARRGEQAQVDRAHPHRFRKGAAGDALDAGESETDVMHNFGWKTVAMVRHYSKATAKDRARRAHQRLSPADRY